MIAAAERAVAERFDALEARFRASVASADFRWTAIRNALGPMHGLRVLDLGCGKGRFAALLSERGAEVVGLDRSRGMIARAAGLDRLQGSATRLPFAAGTFDAAVAVEVFEHLLAGALDPTLREIRRVLVPGGRVAILDKNALSLDARRPWLPSVAIKRLDERRGRWMYPSDGPVRERWFVPGAFRRRLARTFSDARMTYLLGPTEAGRAVFRAIPAARLFVLWTARTRGGEG